MLKWCAYCQDFLGEEAPFEELLITHGMCLACSRRGLQMEKSEEDRLHHLREIQKDLYKAGHQGDSSQIAPLIKRCLKLIVSINMYQNMYQNFTLTSYNARLLYELMKYLKVCLLILGIGLGTVSMAQTRSYIVKSGETISLIALRNLSEPRELYGDFGRVARIKALNPQIEDIHSIFPGDKVFLPDDTLQNQTGIAGNIKLLDRKPAVQNQMSEATAQAPAPVAVLPVDSEKDLVIGIAVSQLFSRIDATDVSTQGQATFASDLLSEVKINLSHVISPNHQLGMATGFLQNKFSDLPPGKSLNSTPASQFIEIQYNYLHDSKLKIKFSAGQTQKIFSRALSVSEYTFDVLQTPYTSVGLLYNVRKRENSSISIGYNRSFLFSTSGGSQESKSGHADHYEVRFMQKRNNFGISENLFWSTSSQNTNLVEQKVTSVGIGVSVWWFL